MSARRPSGESGLHVTECLTSSVLFARPAGVKVPLLGDSCAQDREDARKRPPPRCAWHPPGKRTRRKRRVRSGAAALFVLAILVATASTKPSPRQLATAEGPTGCVHGQLAF
jgi:hypothetical protein